MKKYMMILIGVVAMAQVVRAQYVEPREGVQTKRIRRLLIKSSPLPDNGTTTLHTTGSSTWRLM
ncbi:MAG: hypothetical protein HC859_09940 [Bacteroidia bacterium]|nr:hypothetical protein [Bacteroidia bacterium]